MTTRPQLSRAAAGTIIAIFAILVLAADQFTKFVALNNLEIEVPTPVLGEFLQFYLTFNPGAAFSLGEGVSDEEVNAALIAFVAAQLDGEAGKP